MGGLSPPRRSTAVGIHDVAERAGVSITSVSFVLNGRGGVSEATAQRIRQAASDLGYVGNPHARSLKTGRSLTLAVQLSGGVLSPNSSYFVGILHGAAAETLRHGWTLTVAPDLPKQGIESLVADGAIVIDPLGGEPLFELMRRRGAPVVTIGRLVGAVDTVPSVDNDLVAVTRATIEHLLERGYRRIALLTSETEISYSLDATNTYRAWCQETGQEELIGMLPHLDIATAARVTRELLERPDPPDAFVINAEESAVGVLSGVHESGREVPADVGLAATIDTPVLEHTDPPITAHQVHPDELGRAAARHLIAILDGEEPEPPRPVAAALNERPSSAGPRD